MRDGRPDPATADRQLSRARWQIVKPRALEAAQNRKYADMGLPHEGLLGRATVCTLWRNASDAPLANATPHVVVPQYEGARRRSWLALQIGRIGRRSAVHQLLGNRRDPGLRG